MIYVPDLFISILKTSLSGGIIILLVLLLRLVFRKTPKALICLCWMVAILRLLLPFQIETNWSLQPSTAVLTNRVESFQIPANDIAADEVYSQITYQYPPSGVNSGLDKNQILGIVWVSGMAVMLGYALISYLRLRWRVGECVEVTDGVYWCPGLDTAFLFGYFRPRIYLPEMDEEITCYIRLHEQAHLRRGDHWLMLIGYLALCLHWFNPLVWLSYILLCRDIEAACDERVIRTLNIEERKEYANALLACGKHRSFPVSCPVAFGEVSIKQRILGVLNYRKPAVWVCILLMVALVGVGVFFLTDPVEYPPYYMELMECLDKPLTEVCGRLGISVEDLIIEGRGTYVTPIYVEYAGVTMQLVINTTVGWEGEPLGSFAYTAVFGGSTDEADIAAVGIAHKLYKIYGPGEFAKLSSKPDQFKNISVEEITAAFNDKPHTTTTGRITDWWDITDCGHGNLQGYLETWKASDYWQNHPVTSREDVKAGYQVSFEASYDREQNTKMIFINYRNYVLYDH